MNTECFGFGSYHVEWAFIRRHFRLNQNSHKIDSIIPRALPLAYISSVSQVLPVVIPAGNAVTFWAYRTLPHININNINHHLSSVASPFFQNSQKITYPKGPSCKQKAGHPIEGIAAVLPTHGPFSHPTPVTSVTLFAFVSLAKVVLALVYAAFQSPSPAAAWMGVDNARRTKEEKYILFVWKDKMHERTGLGHRNGRHKEWITTIYSCSHSSFDVESGIWSHCGITAGHAIWKSDFHRQWSLGKQPEIRRECPSLAGWQMTQVIHGDDELTTPRAHCTSSSGPDIGCKIRSAFHQACIDAFRRNKHFKYRSWMYVIGLYRLASPMGYRIWL